jgi:hypothetical protein
MIVIEGFDGSGKSTLASKLEKDLNIFIHHFKAPPLTIEEFRIRCFKSVDLFQKLSIQDRTPYISELIYGVLRENKVLFVSWEEVDKIFKKYKPILIYCRPYHEFIPLRKKYKSKEYQEKIKENRTLLINLYDHFMYELGALRYDYGSRFEPTMYRMILKNIRAKINNFKTKS